MKIYGGIDQKFLANVRDSERFTANEKLKVENLKRYRSKIDSIACQKFTVNVGKIKRFTANKKM